MIPLANVFVIAISMLLLGIGLGALLMLAALVAVRRRELPMVDQAGKLAQRRKEN